MPDTTTLTKQELFARINRVDCGNCGYRREVPTGEVENLADIDRMDTHCACEDPAPNPYIVTGTPLGSDVDDDYEVPRRSRWEYLVDYELADALGIEI